MRSHSDVRQSQSSSSNAHCRTLNGARLIASKSGLLAPCARLTWRPDRRAYQAQGPQNIDAPPTRLRRESCEIMESVWRPLKNGHVVDGRYSGLIHADVAGVLRPMQVEEQPMVRSDHSLVRGR